MQTGKRGNQNMILSIINLVKTIVSLFTLEGFSFNKTLAYCPIRNK